MLLVVLSEADRNKIDYDVIEDKAQDELSNSIQFKINEYITENMRPKSSV